MGFSVVNGLGRFCSPRPFAVCYPLVVHLVMIACSHYAELYAFFPLPTAACETGIPGVEDMPPRPSRRSSLKTPVPGAAGRCTLGT